MELKPRDFDLVVIGSGPGGEGAAMQAAKEGLSVCVVEKFPSVGGSCTHLGTIPSKALRQVAHQITAFQNDALFNSYIDRSQIKFKDLLFRAKMVTEKQVRLRRGHYNRNDIEIITGRAHFESAHEICVEQKNNTVEKLRAKNIIIATGSRPYRPPHIHFDSKYVFDSDTILKLEHLPRTITVYGAGVIGTEYTSIFRSLGRKVNLVNSQSKLLSFLDDEISEALSYHLRDQGVLIRSNESLDKVEIDENGVLVCLKSEKRIRADIALFAVGRTGNSQDLGLESLGITTNSRGYIEINDNYQTAQPHIYAVGDVVGFPSLASSAYDQGRFAASHLISSDCDRTLVNDIPVGIYTNPEISCIGKTEKELTEAKTAYEVGHSSFRHLARAQITGQTVGMLKILFDPATLKIFGIHCFGQNAAEIIHIGQNILSQSDEHNSLKYFINTTFNYPTMAEAYRVAALNGLNRAQG